MEMVKFRSFLKLEKISDSVKYEHIIHDFELRDPEAHN